MRRLATACAVLAVGSLATALAAGPRPQLQAGAPAGGAQSLDPNVGETKAHRDARMKHSARRARAPE